ncbi:Transcription factor [Seminavis robusta]|uniref:Transcription factor n=1 Tax=Seminavis robusta TaxID=568900 RepID=A0A9N8E2V5_9STRA|nr:Transcription factor [Seminavis robusta]|eukprot:Sro500_g155330.1 Transcription factor (133) ;mRNA; f:51521-51919
MNVTSTPETVYEPVVFKRSSGTLKLSHNQLSFHTEEKVCVLPWSKVVQRQVTSTASKKANMEPKFKLILNSGNEAIFQMEDRVSLEVVRDDLGERLECWRTRKQHPASPEVSETVNMASSASWSSGKALRIA